MTGAYEFVSLLPYKGKARVAVLGIKYKNNRRPLNRFAFNLAVKLRDTIDAETVVTWLPTTPEHIRERGFDHAELLANEVAKHLNCRFEPLFGKRIGTPQTKRTRDKRLHGVRFIIDNPERVIGRNIVMIDDVVTTGATAMSGSRALRAAGANRVTLAVVATTQKIFS